MRSASTDQDLPDHAGHTQATQLGGRRARWHELDEFLRRVDAYGLASLGPDGLERLALLYRSASADLARSQSEGWPRQVQGYLNDLVVRAHARVYAVQPRKRLGLLVYFFGVVPTTFRRRWPYVAASTGFSVVVALIAYLAVRHDPVVARQMLGSFAGVVEKFANSGKAAGHYFSDQGDVRLLGGLSFSTFLFLHNLKVALLAFGLGVLGGVLTVYMLITNGIMLGAFLAIGANSGAQATLLSVVAPHGALELPAIFIAGAGGLLMGHAIINPGKWRRGDALKMVAVDALALFMTSVPMFLAAGIIEGNISPRFQGVFGNNTTRFIFACVMMGVMLLYVLFGDRLLGRAARSRIPPPPQWPH